MISNNSKLIRKRFIEFSPEYKLDLFIQLYFNARDLKKAALSKFHPDWNSERIKKETKKIFQNART